MGAVGTGTAGSRRSNVVVNYAGTLPADDKTSTLAARWSSVVLPTLYPSVCDRVGAATLLFYVPLLGGAHSRLHLLICT